MFGFFNWKQERRDLLWQINTLEQTQRVIKGDRDDLRKSLAAADEQVATLNATLQTREDVIGDLQTKARAVDQVKAELEKRESELATANTKLWAERQTHKITSGKLSTQIAALKSIQSTNATLTDRIAVLGHQHKVEVDELIEDVEAFRRDKQELTARVDELTKTVDLSKDAVAGANARADQYKAAMEKEIAAGRELYDRVEDLESEVEAHRGRLDLAGQSVRNLFDLAVNTIDPGADSQSLPWEEPVDQLWERIGSIEETIGLDDRWTITQPDQGPTDDPSPSEAAAGPTGAKDLDDLEPGEVIDPSFRVDRAPPVEVDHRGTPLDTPHPTDGATLPSDHPDRPGTLQGLVLPPYDPGQVSPARPRALASEVPFYPEPTIAAPPSAPGAAVDDGLPREFLDPVVGAGLGLRRCSDHHFQIVGGRKVVNFWPYGRRGFRFSVDGGKAKPGSIDGCVNIALAGGPDR